MKLLVVLAVALACAAAVPIDEVSAPIVKSSYEINPDGAYQYAYETANGIYAQVQGSLKQVSGENPAVVATGAFKYTAPGGEPVELSYVADENGYQPVGSHLPVGPEIPELIARSLVWIAAHPAPAYEKVAQGPAKAYSVLG